MAVLVRVRAHRWIWAAALVAIVGAGVAGVIAWRTTGHHRAHIARTVQVSQRFVGTVLITNGPRTSGCVKPITHGPSTCGLFLILPGQPAPKTGQRVNVAQIVIPSDDNSSYPTLLIYPDRIPPGI